MSEDHKFTYLGDELIHVDNHHLGMIEHEEVLTHKGEMFVASQFWSGVANGGTVTMSGIIPEGTFPHPIYSAYVSGDCKFEIVEGGTLTGGTTVTAYNRNRNAATLSVAFPKHSGTLTGGTVIYTSFIPGGGKNFGGGGGKRANSEWIFHDDRTNTLRVTNLSGGTAFISIQSVFYRGEAIG